MRINYFVVPSVLVAATAAALWHAPDDTGTLPPVLEPDLHVSQFDAWSSALEDGGTVKMVRRPCASQRAEYLERTGEIAPDLLDAGEITTYGPLPQHTAMQSARFLRNIADGTMQSAEEMQVKTLADTREQIQQVLNALKAREASHAVMAGDYWTVERNDHPRLPRGFSYWQMQTDQVLPDGTGIDLFVPLDLSSAGLAPTYDALLALEGDLRGDHSHEFNRLAFAERRAFCEDAWSAARGEAVEREIPRWFWKLEIDKVSWLATPVPARR